MLKKLLNAQRILIFQPLKDLMQANRDYNHLRKLIKSVKSKNFFNKTVVFNSVRSDVIRSIFDLDVFFFNDVGEEWC